MTTGELWVSSSLFPILVWILAAWMLFSTAVFVRTWFRLLRLERYTKSLETLTTEGVGNVAKQIKQLKEEFRGRKDKDPEHARSEEAGIRTETSEPAAAEEIHENGDDDPAAATKDSTRTESGSAEAIATI